MRKSLNTLSLACAVALLPAQESLETIVGRLARIGSCTSPAFSADGKYVAFLSNLGGSPQVWRVPIDGGFPEALTALEDPVARFAYSPDDKWLVLSVAPGGGMNSQLWLLRPDGSRLQRLTDGGKETNDLGSWTHDGRRLAWSSNRRDPRGRQTYLYDPYTGRHQTINDIPGVGGITDVSRDGSRIVYSVLRSRGSNDLVLRQAESQKEIVLTPHEGPGTFQGGLFSPDGQWVYLTSNKDRDRLAFARVPAAGGPLEILAERPDAEARSFVLTEDGSTAALVWNVAGRSELAFIDLKTRQLTPAPKLPAELVNGFEFSRDGKLLALGISGAASPADIWLLHRETGKYTQLTRSPHAGVSLLDLVRPQLRTFKAHDGLELTGWLYRPIGVNTPGPVVLSFHGGPEGQEVPGFNADYQALLARGIAVFAPNVRGSSGFGKKFVNLDNGALRADGVKDIEACVRHVIDTKIADPKRIGIMGGSYGGYMVMAGLTEYPDLFAAGANLFGVVNFETFFKHTEPWMAAISTVEYGDPATQADLLRRLSPIHKVDKVKAPTIVLHGANDTNVPVIEAEQVVDNLKKRGIPVEYILFPDEGHGWRKTSNRLRSTIAITKFFEQHLASR